MIPREDKPAAYCSSALAQLTHLVTQQLLVKIMLLWSKVSIGEVCIPVQGETGTNLSSESHPVLWRSRTRFSAPRKTIVPNQAPTKIHDRLFDCSSCITSLLL